MILDDLIPAPEFTERHARRIAAEPDRDRIWQRFREVAPIDHYQWRAGRRLPVVILCPTPPKELT